MPIISEFQKPHTFILDSAKYISVHSNKFKDEPIYNYYLSQIDVRIADLYLLLKQEVLKLSIEEVKHVYNALSGQETIQLLSLIKSKKIITDVEKIKYIDLILNVFEDIKIISESNDVDEDSELFERFWNDLMSKESEKRQYFSIDDVFA